MAAKQELQKTGVNTNKYVTSFCGVAPIDNPQVVVLVTLYNPTGEGGHQGGGVAAPVGRPNFFGNFTISRGKSRKYRRNRGKRNCNCTRCYE